MNKNDDIKLSSIINFSEMEKVFEYFSVVTKLDVALYDGGGKELLSKRAEGNICILAKNHAVCRQNIIYAEKKSFEIGEPYIYSCGCGLIMCSSPVIFEGKSRGSIVCGPVMLWEADDYAKEELCEKAKLLGINVNLDLLFDKVLSLECVNLTAAVQILFIMINSLSTEYGRQQRQRREITAQQARISELIAEKNISKAAIERIEKKSEGLHYSLAAEKELISYVQTGSKPQANELLNRILGEIFSGFGGDIDRIKIRVFELLAFLSRAAADVGAPLSQTDKIIKKSYEIIQVSSDFEKVCYLTVKAMEEFIDVVYATRLTKKSGGYISAAINYIRKNYSENLTLSTVAKNIYVSSFYLSHLFRTEMNTTYTDYLCKVRIEKAKKALKNKDAVISEVAAMSGFDDPNYFTKVFKKYTGITPKEYKALFK